MSGIGELTTDLEMRLGLMGYAQCEAVAFGADGATVFSAARRAGRTLCAIAALPEDLVSPDAAEAFISNLRKAVTERFRPLPLPGRLVTFTVLLASHGQCQALREHKGRLIDSGRWHVNVMLGTVLVNVEQFRLHSDTTWDLVDTGDHFEQIRRTADAWCGRHRKPNHAALNNPGRLSVA